MRLIAAYSDSIANNHRPELGIHVSGIGLGIAGCSAAVWLMTPTLSWREQWFAFTVLAGRYYPTKPAKMMGKMTVSYGVAQVLAPALTGWLAAGVMAVGTLLLVLLKLVERRAQGLVGQTCIQCRDK